MMIKKWIVASFPGAENPNLTLENFRLEETKFEAEVPEGSVLVKAKLISVDPYMRMRFNQANYFTPFSLGDTVTSSMIGEVVESRSENFAVGDLVAGFGLWQTLAVYPAKALKKLVVKPGLQLENYMSVVGPITGPTALISLDEIARPKAGEVAFVSGAAGAVGLVVGQILKIYGCTVIGSAGSDDKVALLRELGFDHAFNYKTKHVAEALTEFAPQGLDIYYDNVGGEMLEVSLDRMKLHGRVVMCGNISQYNLNPEDRHPLRNIFVTIAKEILIQGFLLGHHYDKMPAALARLEEWLQNGQIKDQYTIVQGFEEIPNALCGLFTGSNTGKMIVRVD